MPDRDEPAKVPVWATVLALLWFVVLSATCLAYLTMLWPRPTPAGISPPTDTGVSTATTTDTTASDSAAIAAALARQGAAETARLCREDTRLKPYCDCLKRVAVMQGVYYPKDGKPQELKNDPACVYLWVPFTGADWFVLWGETRLLLIVMLCGFLGAMIYSLRSFFWYTGHRELVWSWLAMYVLVPIVGSMMAIVFYLMFRGGLFNPSGTISDTSPFGFAAIAALVGMFIQSSALKLKDVFETLMTKAEQGENTVQPAPAAAAVKPFITNVAPPNPPNSKNKTLTITGTGFTSTAKVFGGTTALEVSVANATSITATIPKELIPAAGTKVPITVQTAAGTSAPWVVTAS